MVDFKKDAWLYALIAAVVAIIAILTPWGIIDGGGFDITVWSMGSVTYIGSPVDAWNGAGLTTWTFGLVIASIAALLIYGINTWRGNEFKWDWLIYAVTGLVMIIFPILALVLEGGGGTISFAPIGIIIAGVIAIGAFAVDKFVGGE